MKDKQGTEDKCYFLCLVFVQKKKVVIYAFDRFRCGIKKLTPHSQGFEI